MLRTVLVPLDGSSFAERALPVALKLAKHAGAKLDIVSVYEPPLPPGGGEGAIMLNPRFDAELRESRREYLRGIAASLESDNRITVGTEMLEGGVVEGIVNGAMDRSADIIVLTTHGRSGLSRLWLGSVAAAVARQSHTPVLAIPARETNGDGAVRPAFRRIIIAIDGSPESDAGIASATSLPAASDVEYTLLQVIPRLDSLGGIPSLRDEYERQLNDARTVATGYLESLAAGLRSRGLTVRTATRVHENAAVAITDFAREIDADLVTLGMHSRGALERLVLGSVAEKVLQGSGVPVLLHPSSQRDKGSGVPAV